MSATAQLESSNPQEIHLYNPVIKIITDSPHHIPEQFLLDSDNSISTSKLEKQLVTIAIFHVICLQIHYASMQLIL